MIRHLIPLLLAAQLSLPAFAQTTAKNPLDYSLKQYGLILAVALLGGLASWWTKVAKGDLPAWSVNHLIGELVTSAFSGLVCFWLCESAGVSPLLTAAFAGIAGHMGARAITLMEEWAASKFKKAAP